MQKILLTILFLPLLLASMAQQNIRGKVIDAKSKQPIEAASVSNDVRSFSITDIDGFFSLPITTNLIQVSYIGYKTTLVQVNANEEITIALERDIIQLQNILVQKTVQSATFNTLAKIDLELKPVRNSQEIMRVVPGLFIAQHAGGGKAEQLFLRGFDSDHGTDIKVNVDGIPVNMVSHAHGQGYADAHFIIPETVNNIDFGAGPYYVQQGNFNTAGYVSFATFNRIGESKIQIEAGRFNTKRVLGMFDILKKNKEKQSAYIAAEASFTDGPTLAPQNFSRYNVFGKYNIALNNKLSFTASLSAFKSEWDASGQIPDRAVQNGTIDRFGSIDPSEGGQTERYNANLKLNYRINNNAIWENQLYYSRYKFNLYSNFTFFLNDSINGDGIQQAESRDLYGFNSTLTVKQQYHNWQIKSIYGAGLRLDATQNSRLSNAAKRVFLRDIKLGNIREANSFAFVQKQLTFGRLMIDAGIRADHFYFQYNDLLQASQMPSQQKVIISPKFNLQYNFDQQLQLYIKAGKGFHANDTRVVVANSGNQILPAAYGADLGFIVKPSSRFLLNVAAWYLYLDQEFVYVGDAGIVEPSGKSRRQGIDVLARYQFNNHLFANMNFNLTQPRALGEAKGENFIPLAPTASSTGGIYYKSPKGFNGGISYRYIKNRPANENNSLVAKGYFITDVALLYTQPHVEIGFSIENIFNTQWNEAQFATESRLQNETASVTELHYTPGVPIFGKIKLAVFF